MNMEPLMLIVETSEGQFWGRVHYEDDLLTDVADTTEELEDKLKVLLNEFHDLNPEEIKFEIQYDISALFQEFSFLNISAIAQYADMNAALLRQYASGVKSASAKQVKKIQDALHQIGRKLESISIYSPA